ncbi:MAG: adenosylmethionine decarboxylase [Pseudomonadota bacterium]|nr:adenosylmethionine decarboxylase [Pseudomonadota bacterium]
MSLDDGLFQLGMDLDLRSSTTRTEEKASTFGAGLAPEDRKDFFCERGGVRFAGTHLLVDVVGGIRLDDCEHIEDMMRRAVEASGATLLHIHTHHFTPNGGVSGVAVLAESHISIHSWPECGYAALDIFMCGDADPHKAVDVIEEAFTPKKIIVKELLRGEELDLWNAGSTKHCTLIGASA